MKAKEKKEDVEWLAADCSAADGCLAARRRRGCVTGNMRVRRAVRASTAGPGTLGMQHLPFGRAMVGWNPE